MIIRTLTHSHRKWWCVRVKYSGVVYDWVKEQEVVLFLIHPMSDQKGGGGVCDREAGEKYGEREKSKRNGVRKTKRVKEKQRGEIGYKIERKRLRKGWRRGLRGCGRKSR